LNPFHYTLIFYIQDTENIGNILPESDIWLNSKENSEKEFDKVS